MPFVINIITIIPNIIQSRNFNKKFSIFLIILDAYF